MISRLGFESNMSTCFTVTLFSDNGALSSSGQESPLPLKGVVEVNLLCLGKDYYNTLCCCCFLFIYEGPQVCLTFP